MSDKPAAGPDAPQAVATLKRCLDAFDYLPHAEMLVRHQRRELERMRIAPHEVVYIDGACAPEGDEGGEADAPVFDPRLVGFRALEKGSEAACEKEEALWQALEQAQEYRRRVRQRIEIMAPQSLLIARDVGLLGRSGPLSDLVMGWARDPDADSSDALVTQAMAYLADLLTLAEQPAQGQPQTPGEPPAQVGAVAQQAEGDEDDFDRLAAEMWQLTLSAADLAATFRVEYEPLRKRLERWHLRHKDGYLTVQNPRTRTPTRHYLVSAVWHIISDLRRAPPASA